MTGKKACVIPEGNIAAWRAAFKEDAPLHTQLPVTLKGGESVPGVHITCNRCGAQISGDRVRGRVIQSLPHVVTIEANGLCEPCDRLTHIHCRFRASQGKMLVEWMGRNGQWYARECRKPTLAEKTISHVRRLLPP